MPGLKRFFPRTCLVTNEKTSKIRILVVDDDFSQSLLLRTKLGKRRDYIIETANDGTEALCKVGTFKPDIVLLDICMPGLAGTELLRTIGVFRPGIKIIMVTATRSEELREECLRGGAFSCLWKPIVFDDLCKTIEAAVNGTRAPSDAPAATLSDADMAEFELALKILERQGVISRAEALEELRKIRKTGY